MGIFGWLRKKPESPPLSNEDIAKIKAEGGIKGLIDALPYADHPPDPPFAAHNTAAQALAMIGVSAVEPLLAVLATHEDPRARTGAAEALGHIGDGRAVVPLILALQDRDDRVRARAASALGSVGDERAIEPLKVAAGRDRCGQVRSYATGSLVRIGLQAGNR